MDKNNMKLTIAQFAKVHNINKRTLHYYDQIGLFSPSVKSENGYRYYDISQSIHFEYIQMLKELHMSLDEIMEYCQNPTPQQFLKIAETKEKEMNVMIHKLQQTKKVLKAKKELVCLCESLNESEIRMEHLEEVKLSLLPYDFMEEDITLMFEHIRKNWTIDQIRMGIGRFMTISELQKQDNKKYEGIYTYAFTKTNKNNVYIRPKGTYLCGYQKGLWEHANVMYEKMKEYAKLHHLQFKGYVYEIGLNEFTISKEEDYITKFMIQIQEERKKQ